MTREYHFAVFGLLDDDNNLRFYIDKKESECYFPDGNIYNRKSEEWEVVDKATSSNNQQIFSILLAQVNAFNETCSLATILKDESNA